MISLAGGEALEFDGRGTIDSVVFSPDGERFAIASSGAGVEVFANDGRPLETRALCRPGGAKRATWSADGSRLAAIGDDHSVAIWTASSAGPPICLAHQDKVTGVVFSPDATALATWTRFATVRIWRSDDGRPLAEFEPDGQDSQTITVTFSPDGRHLAIVHERTVELRSAQTYERTAILEGHSASIPHAHFSPDGGRLTTIDREDGAKLWDVETGELLGHERIGVVGPDGSIAWPAAPDELLRIACERLRMHDRESLGRYAQARAICDSLRAR